MFRSMNAHGHFSKENTRSTRDSDESPDSSWISAFSLVSRPAWSLLQRYLPGRIQTACDMKSNLDMTNSLMGGLGDTPLKEAYLHCQHENAACATSGDQGNLPWLTPDLLGELGIQNAAQKDFNMQRQATFGYLGSARHYFSQVLLKTGREKTDTVTVRSANSWWLGGFWGAEDSPQNMLLNVPHGRKETGTTWQHCGEHHSVAYCPSHSQGVVAMTTELRVCSNDGESMHNESAGPLCSKGLDHNASLHTGSIANVYQLPLDDEKQNALKPLVCCRAYSEVAVLTPDQDNGYSSLEEEHSNGKLRSMRLLSKGQEVSETDGEVASEGTTENESHCEPVDCKEEVRETTKDSELSDTENTAEAAEDLPVLPNPSCQNKVIAYIMGSPCSGESESEDSDGEWDSNDDDGFDSEGSSHFSESEDLDDSDDESNEDTDEEEEDSETERLWNSLCQNGDPYNPRNFTAPIRTASKPNPTTESSVSESPPAHMSSHLSSSSLLSSFSENESSEDACDVDEEESLKLWNSFSCSSDPYSLFNFQAPVKTQRPPKSCRKKAVAGTLCYKSEEAEERLDSGFSEISSSNAMGVRPKKVQFVEEVEEFYASSDEDRHGPWEEMARDRCRFQRRVQEVEETISYCLSPTFRLAIFQRLHNTS